MTGTYENRDDALRQKVHPKLKEHYDKLLEDGCAPKHAQLTCRYVAGMEYFKEYRSQVDICSGGEISGHTLRKWYKVIYDEHLPDGVSWVRYK